MSTISTSTFAIIGRGTHDAVPAATKTFEVEFDPFDDRPSEEAYVALEAMAWELTLDRSRSVILLEHRGSAAHDERRARRRNASLVAELVARLARREQLAFIGAKVRRTTRTFSPVSNAA